MGQQLADLIGGPARVVGHGTVADLDATRPIDRARPSRPMTPNLPTRQMIPHGRRGRGRRTPRARRPDAGRRRTPAESRRPGRRTEPDPEPQTRRDTRPAAARARTPDRQPAVRGSRARGEDSVRDRRRRATAGEGSESEWYRLVAARQGRSDEVVAGGFAAAASQISVTRPGRCPRSGSPQRRVCDRTPSSSGAG